MYDIKNRIKLLNLLAKPDSIKLQYEKLEIPNTIYRPEQPDHFM